jgi:5-methylcytosine-specific restriction endonuclease McrA
MSPEEICCAYCGDPHTEWDHLRSIIREKKPTGYITEIAILVPACGKCNQSKGGNHWRDWMLGSATRSPKTGGVANLDRKVMLLE